MTARFIGHYTYNDFCRKIKFPDNDLTVEKIIDLCEFLDGKQFDDNGKLIRNVLDDFLYQIIRKPNFDPEYPEVIMNFIKTDYYSDRVKKDIYKMTKSLEGYENINKMLRSKDNMNDFDLFSLNDINDALYEYGERGEIDKNINVKTPVVFHKYMFALDGEGPVSFIINNYKEDELGKEFLTNVGLIPAPEYYQGKTLNRLEFNEEHLIAIYKEYEKYMPNRKDDFVKFVKTNKEFSPREFVSNYLSFIENDFSYKPASTSKKEIKDIALWRSLVDEKQNDEIKNSFLKYINKDKKVLKK